jgi:hypothetical protein
LHKERECEEVAILNGDSYKFAGTFGFIKKVASKGRDPAYLYDDFVSGLLPPVHIQNVLSCALEQFNGEDVKTDHDKIIEAFIEKAGIQESAYVARVLLSHAMVGSIKKKQIRLKEEVTAMELKTKNFLSTNSRKLGYSLAAISLILIALACTSFSA